MLGVSAIFHLVLRELGVHLIQNILCGLGIIQGLGRYKNWRSDLRRWHTLNNVHWDLRCLSLRTHHHLTSMKTMMHHDIICLGQIIGWRVCCAHHPHSVIVIWRIFNIVGSVHLIGV